MATHLSDEHLEALFKLSSFELNEETRESWRQDLEHWVDFFSIKEFTPADDKYTAVAIGSSSVLREDEVKESLDIKSLKSFCPRLLDGFVALPPQKGEL